MLVSTSFFYKKNIFFYTKHSNQNHIKDSFPNNRKFNIKHRFVYKRGSYQFEMNSVYNRWKYSGYTKKKYRNNKDRKKRDTSIIDPIFNLKEYTINTIRKFSKYMFFAKKIADTNYGVYLLSSRKLFYNRIDNFYWLHFVHNPYYFRLLNKIGKKLIGLKSISRSILYSNKKPLHIVDGIKVLKNVRDDIVKIKSIDLSFIDSTNSIFRFLLYRNFYNSVKKKHIFSILRSESNSFSSATFKYLFNIYKNYFNIRNYNNLLENSVRLPKYELKKYKSLSRRTHHLSTHKLIFRRSFYFPKLKHRKFGIYDLWKKNRFDFIIKKKYYSILERLYKYYYDNSIYFVNNSYSHFSNKNIIYAYLQYRKYNSQNRLYNLHFERNYQTALEYSSLVNKTSRSLHILNRIPFQVVLSRINLIHRILSKNRKLLTFYYYHNKKLSSMNIGNSNSFRTLCGSSIGDMSFYFYEDFSNWTYLTKLDEKFHFYRKYFFYRELLSNLSRKLGIECKYSQVNIPSSVSFHRIHLFDSLITKYHIFVLCVNVVIVAEYHDFIFYNFILKLNLFLGKNFYLFFFDIVVRSFKDFIIYNNDHSDNILSEKTFHLYYYTNYGLSDIIHDNLKLTYLNWFLYSRKLISVYKVFHHVRNYSKHSLLYRKKNNLLITCKRILSQLDFKYDFIKLLNFLESRNNLSNLYFNININKKNKVSFFRTYRHLFYYLLSRSLSTYKIKWYKRKKKLFADGDMVGMYNYSNNIIHRINRDTNLDRSYFSFRSNDNLNLLNTSNFTVMNIDDMNISKNLHHVNSRLYLFLIYSVISHLRLTKYTQWNLEHIFRLYSVARYLSSREYSINIFLSKKKFNIHNRRGFICNHTKSYVLWRKRVYSFPLSRTYYVISFFSSTLKICIIDTTIFNSFAIYGNFLLFFNIKSNSIFCDDKLYQSDYYIRNFLHLDSESFFK